MAGRSIEPLSLRHVRLASAQALGNGLSRASLNRSHQPISGFVRLHDHKDDVDGDGYIDVVIGATVPERAFVYAGSATGPAITAPAILVGPDA